MKVTTISKDGKIVLPPEIARKFEKINKFIVYEDGEKIILNPIKIVNVSKIAKRIKGSKSMSMEEVSEEIHRYREEKKWKKNR